MGSWPIGEYHLGAADAGAPTVGPIAELAAERDLFLQARTDVAHGGTLDPEWWAVFVKYLDRFMVGTDTWVRSRWAIVRDYHRAVEKRRAIVLSSG